MLKLMAGTRSRSPLVAFSSVGKSDRSWSSLRNLSTCCSIWLTASEVLWATTSGLSITKTILDVTCSVSIAAHLSQSKTAFSHCSARETCYKFMALQSMAPPAFRYFFLFCNLLFHLIAKPVVLPLCFGQPLVHSGGR